MVRHVEEWHGPKWHLTGRVRLTDPQEHREVRGDPEEEQWQQADADTACIRVGIDGDRKARDEPEVPNAETQPARSDGSTGPDLDSGASGIWPEYGAVGGHATALTSVTRSSATIRPSRIRMIRPQASLSSASWVTS